MVDELQVRWSSPVNYGIDKIIYLFIMKFICIVISLLFLGCTHPVQINLNEVKQIFKTISEEDLTKTKNYIIDSFEHSNEKSITEDGVTYYAAEFEDSFKGVWTQDVFANAVIISHGKLDSLSQPDPMYHTPTHYSFSLPYFSKDKKTFLIYYNFYCGNLCAEWSLKMFKKEHGKWKFVKNLMYMVS